MKLDVIDTLPQAEARRILRMIFERASVPAFGVLPQRELDLLLFEAMRDAGVIKANATLYELMTGLKITKAKARNLLFDLEIRDAQAAMGLDDKARDALANPRGFVMDGAYLAFGIENPVVQAHIKDKVSALGHLTDASFDASIVKIKPEALGALVEGLMDDDDRAVFREGMIAAGFDKDENLATLIREGLTFVAKKTVGEAATDIGAGYLDQLAAFIQPHARRAKDKVAGVLTEVFAERQRAQQSRPAPRARSL